MRLLEPGTAVGVSAPRTDSVQEEAMAARDYNELEARRLRAARLFAGGGLKQADIARKLRVSPVSVHRWHEAWRRGGIPALRGAGRAGRKSRLAASDVARLKQALLEGASAHGFPTRAWTLSRVARVIEQITGVRYHPGHVWRVLRDVLHWAPKRRGRSAEAPWAPYCNPRHA